MAVNVVKYKRKVMVLSAAFVCFVTVIGLAWSLIFAAMKQTVETGIRIRYIAKEVAGTVSATYQVKNKEENALPLTVIGGYDLVEHCGILIGRGGKRGHRHGQNADGGQAEHQKDQNPVGMGPGVPGVTYSHE